MTLITGPHRILFTLLQKLGLSQDKRLKPKSVNLLDFGARIKVIVSNRSANEGRPRIELEVTFREEYEIHENETIEYLTGVYGPCVRSDRFGEGNVVLSIVASEAAACFGSPDGCAWSLSQIRVQAAGAPILKALSKIDDLRLKQPDRRSNEDDAAYYKLGRHGKCGTYHCIGTSEKVMVVFVVSFEDEMERCLARLFLQQFEATQRKIPLTPHCEYRRPNQATKELLGILNNNTASNDGQRSMPPPVGFLSFTFFPSSAASDARRRKAVDLMVNFFPYMNQHVKSTKSMMLNRMRSKKNDLLPSLQEPAMTLSW